MTARHRRLIVITAFVVSFCGFRVLCNHFLGKIVGGIFANGTQSRFSYLASEFEFLPLRGTLYGVRLQRPADTVGGLSIERISVRLNPLALLKKRVALSRLQIDGTTIRAEQSDSAFWALLDYLFGGAEPQGAWPVSVSDVRVRTRNAPESLRLIGSNYQLVGSNVDFFARTDSPAEEDPFFTTAKAPGLKVSFSGSPETELGQVELDGTLGGAPGARFKFKAAAGALPLGGEFAVAKDASAVSLSELALGEFFGGGRMNISFAPGMKFDLAGKLRTAEKQPAFELRADGKLEPFAVTAHLENEGDATQLSEDEQEDEEAREAPVPLSAELAYARGALEFRLENARAGWSLGGVWTSAVNGGRGDFLFNAPGLEGLGIQIGARTSTDNLGNSGLKFETAKIGEKALALSGTVTRAGWDLALSGSFDLDPLGARLGALEQLSGELQVNFNLRGELTAPTLGGDFKLVDGGLSFPLGPTVVGAEEIKLTGRFESDALVLEEFAAEMGGGTIQGRGRIEHVFDAAARAGELKFDLSEVGLEPSAGAFVLLGGEVVYRETPKAARLVAGELNLERALYERTVDVRAVIDALTQFVLGKNKVAAQTAGVSLSGVGADLNYDLHLLSDGGALVETNIAQAELRADLWLRGTAAAPHLEGQIEALRGVFGFQAQEFQLLTALLTFAPERRSLDPELNFLGETTVKTPQGEEQRVYLSVGGTLTAPRLEFRSDSGLNENQIVALLGNGNSGGIQVIGREGAAAGYAEVFNPNSDLSLRDRIGGITGLSEVQIVPAFSPTTGEFAPKVVGKRPLAGGLELKLESELTSRQASGAELDVPLTGALSAVGGWKSSPVTGDVRSGSGAFHLGLRLEQRFPGTGLWPGTNFRAVEEIND